MNRPEHHHSISDVGAAVHRIEEAVEHTIEHGVEVAEATIVRRFGSRALAGARIGLKTAAWALVIGYFAFGILLLVTRYAILPRIDQLRPRVEAIATRVLKAPVTIGRIEAAWRGLNPHLALNDVRVGRDGANSLALPRVEATVSWSSLLVAAPRFTSLHILAPELEVARLADGRYSIAGFVVDPGQPGDDGRALDWILAQGRVAIRDARIRYRDERQTPTPEVEFTDVNFLLESGFGTNELALQARPPAALAGPLDVRARVRHEPLKRRSHIARWDGEIYTELGYADIAAIARLAGLQLEMEITHAHGALRGWLSFDDARIARLVADLALKEVDTRLAADLEPLKVASLQGRLTVRRWIEDAADAVGGFELLLSRLTFETASGLSFPPLDISLRQTRETGKTPESTEIEASLIDLESLAGVARSLPLPHDLREPIMRHAIRGTVSGLTARWSGPAPRMSSLTLKTRFTGLTGAPQPDAAAGGSATGLPGFENLSGTIEMANGAGSLQLASKGATLIFPRVFEDPRLPFDRLNAVIRWKSTPTVDVRVESLTASNPDLEVNIAGNWRATSDGPGAIDLNGRVVGLNAPAAFRYVPTVAGQHTRQWLQHAIVSGRVNDATVRLRGELARFPFRDGKEGEFRISGRVTGATLDVAPGEPGANGRQPAPGSVWPLLTGIDADLLFERASMTIRAQRGAAFGARIENTTARIANFGENPVLEVNGQASGPLADMIRYANGSPVARWIGGLTEGADTRGNAKLNLKLDIPLADAAKTRVAGSVQMSGSDVKLAGVPPFSRVNGTIGFSERGVRFENLTAGFLGGNTRIDAKSRADGATVVSATGIVTPAGLQPLSDSPILKRVLDRMQGSARVSSSMIVHQGTTQLQIESDLVGLAVDGVAPLRKTAGEAMPLRIDHAAPGGERDELSVALGRLLAVRLERRRERGEYRTVRGVIALNTPANLPESGLLLNVSLPRLDVEAWTNWLGEGAVAPAPGRGPASAEPPVDYIALQAQELVIMRRSFRNLTLGASLSGGGLVDANVSSDNLVGQISWRPGPTGSADAAGLGRIRAHLSKLIIPNAEKDNVATVLRAPTRQLPSIELIAENFDLGEAKLGRLDLVARNTGTPAASAWRLRQLDITNGDLKFTASGDWLPANTGARQTKLNFKLDAADVGGALTRLGFGNTMTRGRSIVEGAIDWIGSPLEIDYPTLSGNLTIKIDNGRFLRVDTSGPARLLTLLSLQSLARTLGTTEARDTFGSGFEFTSIAADLAIARGVLTTQNFRMVGANAAVLMSGTIDLNNETQNLLVVVLPEIDASTAALALTVVNPIVGLGTFLAQTLLRNPLSKAFALEYEVTGRWTEPVVTRRSRVTPQSQEAVR